MARQVVATDISPRAIGWARFNARFNGIANIELRAGDLFEPVRGERFDRIVAHPPFVAMRAGLECTTFIHGGTRGDELALRLLEGAARHLLPGGRAVLLADWPVVGGDALEARVRAAVNGADVDVLVLQSPSKNLDEYCAMHAAVEHRELGEEFARAAIAQRDHLETLGLRGLALAFVVLEPSERPWTALVSIRHVSDVPVTAEAIDRIALAHALAHRKPDAILAGRLRTPGGTRFTEQASTNDAPSSVVAHLPPGRPQWPLVLDASSAEIVARISQSPTVAEAVGASDRDEVERVARDALLRGVLEVA